MPIYVCRDWMLNTEERRIVKNGKFLDLTPKSFDVVHMLVERRGEIVTKDDILGVVWQGSFVEEGNLPVHISKIRRALGETKETRVIETIAGVGYRFVGPVDELVNERSNFQNASHASKPRLAVLPFENSQGMEEMEYLVDGFSEHLSNRLSQTEQFDVIARNTVFRYKNLNQIPTEIGETLGADLIVTGRVRLVADRIAVSIELTRVADGVHLWGNSFDRDRDQLIALQERTYEEISQFLSFPTKRTPFRQAVLDSVSNESVRLRLKAMYLMRRRDSQQLQNAISLLEKAIALDSTHLLAYVDAVECYLLNYGFGYISRQLTLTRIAPLLKFLRQSEFSHDGIFSVLGAYSLLCELNLKAAEQYLRQAIVLNPNSVSANRRLADVNLSLGNFNQASERIERLLLIDPMSFPTLVFIGRCFYRMGRFDIALSYFEDTIEMEPNDFTARALLGACLIERGEHDLAQIAFEESERLHPHPETRYLIAYNHAVAGETERAELQIHQLLSNYSNEHAMYLARVFAALGKTDEAFSQLEVAVSMFDADLRGLRTDPRLRFIASDRRFDVLVNQIGLR